MKYQLEKSKQYDSKERLITKLKKKKYFSKYILASFITASIRDILFVLFFLYIFLFCSCFYWFYFYLVCLCFVMSIVGELRDPGGTN